MTRKEHIVPRGLLSNFVDSSGRLWVYERDRPVRESRPDKECAQRDFYEYEWQGRRTQNRYEKWLGQIESDALPLIAQLIERRPLTRQQSIIFSAFVATLFMRTRKVRSQISNAMVEKFGQQSRDPGFIRDLQYQLFREGELRYAEDLQKRIDELREGMETSPSFYHVVGLPRQAVVLGKAIIGKSWETIAAPAGASFVVSDCPVSTVEFIDGHVFPGAGLGKDNAAIFLPLTAKHVFVASRLRWRQDVNEEFVKLLNRLTIGFAHRNVYASEKSPALQALVDVEINQIVFGQNAFIPSN